MHKHYYSQMPKTFVTLDPTQGEQHADIGLKVQLEVRLIEGPAHRASLVFLHEGLGSVSQWTQRDADWPLALCQASGRAGMVYARRGYGQSSPALRSHVDDTHPSLLMPDYMHKEAWQVLPSLLEKLHIKNPVLLGHSDGASIALLHASVHRVAACIAMAPHVLVESMAIDAITNAKTAFESTDLRQRLARHHADVEGAFWQWNDVWLSPAFRQFDIRADCARLLAPLLLIQGDNDEYGSMLQLDEIARQAKHAQQLRLSDCGHSPQRDQPQKTLAAICGFLQNCN
ncbi:2-succinyl-6-hydroxy-2,4-cyclohexadiene-1-carboxylate synthase [Polaromonas vacuolata]|uniref:2-succinyl-6-hydroxy-2, 4-cyclohexadiene-1-carboxylate synthase n=1 Tax=Polaromonas vacuolata TaxID=37448 RepID=A0A6H2HBL0_9BURK|nr:alpha/beta hydrolase [Polaromonas vacuolata]QJC57259.1 2-succinyl-6-hydroxy-2,4-cyclohexadiene-1-carboxylate synthase [Polaromonas vacuolata]